VALFQLHGYGLVELVGLGWSAVSRHLAVLKAAGVLDDEKRGLQVFYRVALPCVATFTDCLKAAGKGTSSKARRCCA
jgi:ArsR family transcriptional regulator